MKTSVRYSNIKLGTFFNMAAACRPKLKPIDALLSDCEQLDDELNTMLTVNPYDYVDEAASLQSILSNILVRFGDYSAVNNHAYDRLIKNGSIHQAEGFRIRKLDLRSDIKRLLSSVKQINIPIVDLNLTLLNSTINSIDQRTLDRPVTSSPILEPSKGDDIFKSHSPVPDPRDTSNSNVGGRSSFDSSFQLGNLFTSSGNNVSASKVSLGKESVSLQYSHVGEPTNATEGTDPNPYEFSTSRYFTPIPQRQEEFKSQNSSFLTLPPPSNPNPFPQSFTCLLYTSPSPRDKRQSRMPSSA